MNPTQELFKKYDVPAPRYTSYPTVPFWSDPPSTEQWLESLRRQLATDPTLSIYIHVPFCESLCTFCGCNNTITRNHGREEDYVLTVLKEWSNYKHHLPQIVGRKLNQLHLGGGTPTFLSAENLKRLVSPLLNDFVVDLDHFEGSLEVDPRRTHPDQLLALHEIGFRRVSMGVQDFNPEVQRLINRQQPFSQTKELTEVARQIGYDSINYDLIYGLPAQTPELFSQTIEKTIELRPDRIALYSFALVPWIKPAQRLFRDEDLPTGENKLRLYELARNQLLAAGYHEIGMDHFALKTDALYASVQSGRLHRNFMGYTDQPTDVLLGLGVSAISEIKDCFHQNEKVLPVYERRVKQEEIPTLRGHRLTEEDQIRRRQILKFMTTFRVKLTEPGQVEDVKEYLSDMLADGLVEIDHDELKLTESGKPFLRYACMALDQRLRLSRPERNLFSQAL